MPAGPEGSEVEQDHIGPAGAPGGGPLRADQLSWPVRRVAASPSIFAAEPAFPSITFVSVDAPLLVLGSTQRDDVVVAPSAAVPVARRRSGGGAVLLEPERVAWVDIAVPASHPLWDTDVSRAFHWLGDVWARAIGKGAVAHHGPNVRSALSDLVCFAGLGAGEVTTDGRKVVGISQRRTRAGALFQCGALIEWEPSLLASLLGLDASSLRDVAVGLAPMRAADIESAFLDALGVPS